MRHGSFARAGLAALPALLFAACTEPGGESLTAGTALAATGFLVI